MEEKGPRSIQQGADGELPHGRSEPRLRQAENRIADEVLAILAEAALENEQIDKAMAAMGIAQNFEEGGESRRDARRWIKVPTHGSGAGGRIEDKGRMSGLPIDLDHVLRQRGKHESRQPGTRGTCWVSSGNHRWISRSSASNHTGRTAVKLVLLCRTKREL